MKILLTILILAVYTEAFSQTKICEENSMMYSVCYNLDSNGGFRYKFQHCTGSVLGIGSYVKTKNSIRFTFDSITSPQIYSHKVDIETGKVEISYHHLTDGYPMEFEKVNYNGQSYFTDSIGIIKINYSGGPIVLYQSFEKDSIVINPANENSNNKYEVLWHSAGDTFMKQGTSIIMKKTDKKYKFKEKVLGYNNRTENYFPMWKTTYYILK